MSEDSRSDEQKQPAAEQTQPAEEKPKKPAPRRPAAPARPSIYSRITESAKKAEEARAAKVQAQKEKALLDKAAAAAAASVAKPLGAAAKTPVKKAASPFLTAPITRSPAKPAATAAGTPPPTAPAPAMPPALETPVAAEPTPPVAELVAPAPVAEPPAAPIVPPPPAEVPSVEAPKAPQKAPAPQAPSETAAPKPVPPKPAAPRAEPTTRPPRQQTQTVPARPGSPGTPSGGRPMPQRPGGQPPYRGGYQQRPPQRQTRRRHVTPAAPVAVAPPPPPKPAGPVALPAIMTVRDLAETLSVPVGELLKRLLKMKIMATINQSLDYDTASVIAEEFERKTKPAETAVAATENAKAGDLRTIADKGGESRPPIVTVLGHVDHGKTSLLDAIRNTRVAAGEAGGITQHIGAYQIEKQGRKITFLDTPGHEAFTAMRARGAQMTDVAVLVVAADDGVMPQTIEAINHARAANVPIVVALNKIDRETADPARVMRQLSDNQLVVEEWGGDTPMVKVSARKGTGIDELLDMILLVADLEEHKADPAAPALGSVVEAEVDRSRGPVATLLVQNGTLRQGDFIAVGSQYGRIRAMFDDRGERIGEAGPSTPVLVLGLPGAPEAGSTFRSVADEKAARGMAGQHAADTAQAGDLRAAKALSLDDLYAQMQAGRMHELNLIVKADVNGSLEPIRNSVDKLSTEHLHVRVLHQGLGNVSESDVSLALASKAIVVAFNVDVDPAAKRLASVEGVDVRQYSIIYQLIEDVDKALQGLLEPTYKEVISGRAEVRALFKVAKRQVAGCFVTEGKVVRGGQVRLLRAGKKIWDGRVAGLKRFTEDVREVATNFECGVMLEGYEDVKQGDVLEFYHKEKEA